MKRLMLAVLLIGCGSENTGTQSSAWPDYCHLRTSPYVENGLCENIDELKCDDGMYDIVIVPALASNYIGTVCYHTPQQDYFYVCGINEKNEAWVYCNYQGQ